MAYVSERLGDGERHDEHGRHRPEHPRANPALLGLERVRQPREADPRPPDRREDQESMPEAAPREVLRHQLCDLGDGEDHDEVEEELQGCDPLLPLDRLTAHIVTA